MLWLSRRHGRVAGGVLGARGAGSPVVDHVGPEVGPVQGGGSPLKHGGSTPVTSMQVIKNIAVQ